MPNVDHSNYVCARCQSPAFTTSKFHLKPIYVDPSVFVDQQKSALGISLVLQYLPLVLLFDKVSVNQQKMNILLQEKPASGKTAGQESCD